MLYVGSEIGNTNHRIIVINPIVMINYVRYIFYTEMSQ